MNAYGGAETCLHSFLTPSINWGEWYPVNRILDGFLIRHRLLPLTGNHVLNYLTSTRMKQSRLYGVRQGTCGGRWKCRRNWNVVCVTLVWGESRYSAQRALRAGWPGGTRFRSPSRLVGRKLCNDLNLNSKGSHFESRPDHKLSGWRYMWLWFLVEFWDSFFKKATVACSWSPSYVFHHSAVSSAAVTI
jgi:hypothetical protein